MALWNIWGWWLSFQCALSWTGPINGNTNTANMTASTPGWTGDTHWRYDENMTTFCWTAQRTSHHHVVFYVGAARCSKTVSHHYLSLFCAPLSIQSALSPGKFINYECWVEDPNKDFLLLKCSCFSKYTWDISQIWQGIDEAKILSYVGWTLAKRFQGFLTDPECMSQMQNEELKDVISCLFLGSC